MRRLPVLFLLIAGCSDASREATEIPAAAERWRVIEAGAEDTTVVDALSMTGSSDIRRVWIARRGPGVAEAARAPRQFDFRCSTREVRAYEPAVMLPDLPPEVGNTPAQWSAWEAIRPENWLERAHTVVCQLPLPPGDADSVAGSAADG